MKNRQLTRDHLATYAGYLLAEERSSGTIEKYTRDVEAFARWMDGEPVTRERAAEWREHLVADGYAPTTVNSMLAALNGLFRFLGWEECRVKFLKVQRRLFRDRSRELTRPEYDRLLEARLRRGPGATCLTDGGHLLDGYPGQRSEVSHRGGSES